MYILININYCKKSRYYWNEIIDKLLERVFVDTSFNANGCFVYSKIKYINLFNKSWYRWQDIRPNCKLRRWFKIYLCLNCYQLFEKLTKYKDEQLEHFGTLCQQEFNCCPYCKDTGCVETKKCTDCDEYITGKYAEGNNSLLCENCYTEKDITNS